MVSLSLFASNKQPSSGASTPDLVPDATATSSTALAPVEAGPSTAAQEDAEENAPYEPLEKSPFFQRLKARGTHCDSRIKEIRQAGLTDLPPEEPPAYLCCGSSCGINCVVTIWWEEEKVWRDCHDDWKGIKERLKEEEEDRLRSAEEEEALSGPSIKIEVEPAAAAAEDPVPKLASKLDSLAF